tara:strand:- start:1450 stop:3696 length:2247 start_codon:yes stop_codon:yes gene_type:complete
MPTDPNDTKKIKENTQATDDNVESKENLIKAIERLNKSLKQSNDEKLREIQYNSDLAAMQNDRTAQEGELYKLLNLRLAMEKEAIDVGKGQTEEYMAQKQAIEEHIRAQAEMLGLTEEQTEAMLKQTKAFDENRAAINKFAKTADGVFSDLATKAAIFGDPNKGLLGTMTKFAAEARNSGEAAKIMGNSFLKHFNFTTLAAGMVENIIESTIGMVKAFDEASASLAAATGTGDQFTGMMLEMRMESNDLGVTFENSSKAIQSLIRTQVGFLNSSKAAQKEMATQVALMDRIGISTDTSAEIMNVFTVTMGKSQKSAIEMTKSLVSMGGVLGDSQKFLEDFNKSMETLAVYGEDAVGVFSNMAAAARAAGVEVGTLAGMAGKFDKYEEAAETVGKLNALMGTQLSTTEMLFMKEDQRIETLIQQVQISGESFANMNKFQQMAIANAAGITDMNEAQKIFGMSMREYKTYQRDMQRQAQIQENFNKALEATEELSEKFKQFMAEFAMFVQPLLDAASGVLDFLTSIASGMDDTTKYAIGAGSAVLLLVTAFAGASAGMPALGAGAGVIAAGVTAMTAALTAAAPAMAAVGAAAAGAAAGLGTFAVPLVGIGLAIAGAAMGIGYLISSFVDLTSIGPNAFDSISTLATGISDIKKTIGEDTSQISNALENLALIATGTSAKAMKGGSVALTTELKEAVQAVMTTKIDITLRVDDGGLKKVVKDAVVDVLNNKNEHLIRNRIINIAGGDFKT